MLTGGSGKDILPRKNNWLLYMISAVWHASVLLRMPQLPEPERFAIALQGLVVAIEDAGIASALAAFLKGGFPGRLRPGVVWHGWK